MAHQSGQAEHVVTLEVITDLLLSVEGNEPPESFYNRLCEAVCRVTAMTRATIFDYDRALQRATMTGSFGLGGDGFQGSIQIESSPMILTALQRDRVVTIGAADGDSLPRELFDALGSVAPVCTPMIAGDRWVGLILTSGPAEFGQLRDSERSLLWTLGKTVALAAVARQATTQGERARQLEERISWARTIHDSAIQRVFGVYLALSGDRLETAVQERCADELEGALNELRSSIERPLVATTEIEATSVAQEIARIAALHPGLDVKVEVGDPASVPRHLEMLSQAVFVEAVRNALGHAKPRELSVRFDLTPEVFTMEIINDGVTGHSHGTGLGLRLIALEALGLGATVEGEQLNDGRWRTRLVASNER
ncbi:MAG: GAF domain-containing protein [Actinomycetota bacterium]